jgi:uncharacterized protein YdhG (YjbR/CyaY superfamily)
MAADEKMKFENVDDYIAAALPEIEPRLVQMRDAIRSALPDAEETISYNIPAYKQHRVVVIQFAGFTSHTSLTFYPTAKAFARFAEELEPFKTSKSAITFPLDAELPLDLVSAIAAFRLTEAEEFAARKKSGK